MADAPALATWEDVKNLTGEEYDVAQQARLTLLLASASQAIRDLCGWHLYPLLPEDEVVVDGSGADVQMLPTLRLVTLHALEENGSAVDLERVQWSAKGFLRRDDCQWTRRLRGITATITHGYVDLPNVRQLVAEVAAARLWVLSRPGAGVINQLQTGPFMARWDVRASMSEDQLEVLAPYTIGV